MDNIISTLTVPYGSNAEGVEIDEPFDATGMRSATLLLESFNGRVKMTPFTGMAATLAQANPAKFQFSWPNPMPDLPVGMYLLRVVVTFGDGRVETTGAVLLTVIP